MKTIYLVKYSFENNMNSSNAIDIFEKAKGDPLIILLQLRELNNIREWDETIADDLTDEQIEEILKKFPPPPHCRVRVKSNVYEIDV